MEAILSIRRLGVSYQNGNSASAPVLRNLDLELSPGEAVGIFGASGTGKTTLARSIPGLLPAGSIVTGKLVFDGANLLEQSGPSLRRMRGRHIGLIPQEPFLALNPFMKVGKQVEEVLRAHFQMSTSQLRDKAAAAMRSLFPHGVDRIADRYPHQLSGGERQRVVVCQAIVCGPALLIADEPTSALDSISQKSFLDLLRETCAANGASLLFISHNRAALRYVAGRCLELREGRLHA